MDLEGMQKLAFTCSITKLGAVGVGTRRHLLPMTTPVGCTHHLSFIIFSRTKPTVKMNNLKNIVTLI